MSVDVAVLVLVALLSFALSYFGSSVGLVLGQLRLPVLIYWLGSPSVGTATSLAISAVAALIGATRHARQGRVEVRLLFTIGLPSAAAAFVSARWATRLDPALVKTTIGVVLIVHAGFMLRARRAVAEAEADTEPSRSTPAHVMAEVATGGALGAMAGMVGLLLGTLRLPVMLRLGVPATKAVGSNMAIGALTGLLAGVATFLDGTINLLAFAVIAPATVLGSYLGASATGRMQKETLHRLIAWTLVAVGAWMIVEPWLFG